MAASQMAASQMEASQMVLPACNHDLAKDSSIVTRTKYFSVALTCGTNLNGIYVDCERCHRSDIVRAIIDLIGDSFRQRFTAASPHAHTDQCKIDTRTLKISSLPIVSQENEKLDTYCACKECVSERLRRGKITVCACPLCPSRATHPIVPLGQRCKRRFGGAKADTRAATGRRKRYHRKHRY